MKMTKHWLPLVVISVLLLTGCEKKVIPDEQDQVLASAQVQKINGFIKEVMTDLYLWYDKLPDIDIKYETNSKDYFQKLLYSEDKWSFITDDITAFEQRHVCEFFRCTHRQLFRDS
jgi:carboxyl-terminal processing protease